VVKKLERNGKSYYVCELCNVAFAEEKWAKKCTEWCSEHCRTCSIEVVQHAVKIDEDNPGD
jgi:hypothetical protein